jgi:hypothetical protein
MKGHTRKGVEHKVVHINFRERIHSHALTNNFWMSNYNKVYNVKYIDADDGNHSLSQSIIKRNDPP